MSYAGSHGKAALMRSYGWLLVILAICTVIVIAALTTSGIR